MPARGIVMAMVAGCALIALGLTRGPAARLRQGLGRFHNFLLGMRPEVVFEPASEYLPGQFWLAVIGGAFVLLAWAVYLAGN